VRAVGVELRARRDELAARARAMGLMGTRLGPAVTALVDAASPLDRARLVTAVCRRGRVFLLVAPPRTPIAADEDPAAHVDGGWEPFVASPALDDVLRGPIPERVPPQRVHDAPARPDGVDPWIPVTEIEL
jgi:hypothetical protein